jgi:hypothetical protein
VGGLVAGAGLLGGGGGHGGDATGCGVWAHPPSPWIDGRARELWKTCGRGGCFAL